MKFNNFHLVISCLIFLLLQSCSRNVYYPTSQVVPVFDEGGNLKLGVDLGIANPLENDVFIDDIASIAALRLRGGYALTDNLGMHLETSISLDTSDYRTYSGLALGYYSHLADNTFFQLYLMGRTGIVDSNGSSFRNEINAKYTSIGLQPGVGYEDEKYYVGLFTTLKRINYSELETTNPESSENPYLIEPSAGFSYRFGKFSFDAELGASFGLATKTTTQAYIGVGLTFNLDIGNKKQSTDRKRTDKKRGG